MTPRLTDDDHGEISVTLDGREIRGWSYANDAERRQKMLHAREYIEGYCEARDSTLSPQDGEAALDIRSISQSIMDGRCLEVWFAKNVTPEDRAALLRAVNYATHPAAGDRAAFLDPTNHHNALLCPYCNPNDAVRAAVIEECAKVADAVSGEYAKLAHGRFRRPGEGNATAASDAADDTAVRIRSLAPKGDGR